MKKFILLFTGFLFIYSYQINSQWSPNWTATNTWATGSNDQGVKLVYKDSYIYVVGHTYDNSSSTPYSLRTIKYNTSGTQQWAATYSSSTLLIANGIDVDSDGNVYIVGTKGFGSSSDYVTIKYNSSGSQQWATTYNGGGQDEASDIVLGTFSSTTYVYVTGGSMSNSDPATMDIYTICYYSTSGGQYWADRFNDVNPWPNTNGDDKAFCIAIKNSTNGPSVTNGVYVGGWYDDGNDCYPSDCYHDAQIVHYNFDGSTVETDHAVHYGCGPEAGEDWIADIVVSNNTGNVYGVGAKWCQVGGYAGHEMFVFECNWEWDEKKGIWEFYYSSDFCNNSRYRFINGGENIGTSIVIDEYDNTYVTGYSDGNGTGIDIITYKCDPYGSIVWNNGDGRRYNSSGSNPDVGNSIAINSSHVFVTGFSGYGGSNSDIKTIQYDISTGNIVCVATYNGSSNIGDIGSSVAVNGGDVYVTGTTNEIDNSGNSSDIITLKYTESGCSDGDKLTLQNNHKLQSIPREFSLTQNYPNPFNPTTNISFGIPMDAIVTLRIFDVVGKEIAVLVNNQNLSAGNYSYDFDASELPSGIYYYKLDAGEFSDVKKMAVIK